MNRNNCCIWITKVLNKGGDYFRNPTDKTLASLEKAVSKSWGAMDDECWGIPAEDIAPSLNKVRESLSKGYEKNKKTPEKGATELLIVFSRYAVYNLSKYEEFLSDRGCSLSGGIDVTINYCNDIFEREEEIATQKIDKKLYEAIIKIAKFSWDELIYRYKAEAEGFFSLASIEELWQISHERDLTEHFKNHDFEDVKEKIEKTKGEHLSTVIAVAIKVYGIEKMSSWLVDFLGEK